MSVALDSDVLGKYQIIANLGHGGMADVYLAASRGLAGSQQLVVIKQLRASLALEQEFISMFLDEARLASRLNHANVVQTLEVGNEGSRHYLAMEYLDGQTLHHLLQRIGRGSLPIPMHIAILCEVLAGLHYSHELADFDGTPLRVVHRDVSPHNIFITYDGRVKVMDFGIAKAANCLAQTKAGMLKGKLTYMAPEQARSDTVDRRADIFSVGAMLWEAVTGERMWAGVTDLAVVKRLLAGDIPSLAGTRPEAPDILRQVVAKAIAPDPEQRFATAEAMREQLQAILDDLHERISPRDIGAYLHEHFSDDRSRTRSLIEAQMHRLRQRELANGHEPSELRASDTVDLVAGGDSLTGSGATNRPVGGKRAIAFGAAVLAAVVLATTGLLVWRTRSSQGTHPIAPLSGQSSQAPSAVASAPTLRETTELVVETTPPGARVFVDDTAVGISPVSLNVERDGLDHRVRAEADSGVSRVDLIRFDKPRASVTLSLDRSPVVARDTSKKTEKKRDKEPAAGGDEPPSGRGPTPVPGVDLPTPPAAGSSRKLDPSSPWAK